MMDSAITGGMEPMAAASLAANVVQFVEFGAKVIKRLHDFRTNQGEVPQVFLGVSVRLGLLVDSLKHYNPDGLTRETETALTNVLTTCHAHGQRLEKTLKATLPSKDDSWASKEWKALLSLRKEKEVRAIDGELGKCIEILTLHHVLPRSLKPLEKVDSATWNPTTSERHRCRFFEVPRRQVSRFVGRTDILDLIDRGFEDSAIVVLCGIGGQGKTQTALEYCRRARNASRYEGIFWLDAASERQLRRAFEMVAESMKPAGRIFESPEQSIAFVKQQLHTFKQPWLLVFDNYDDPKGFPNILDYVSADGGHILFTTRHNDVCRHGKSLPLSGMTEDDSIDLFLYRAGMQRDAEHIESVKEIAERLGYHPLAIDHAAAYLRKRQTSLKVSDFLEHYQQRKQEILSCIPQVWEYKRRTSDADAEVAISVYTTWQLSYEQLLQHSRHGEAYSRFLTLLGFFHYYDISELIFNAFWQSRDRCEEYPEWMRIFLHHDTWCRDAFEDALIELRDLSLIETHYKDAEGTIHVSLHPLVKDWIQLRCDVDMRYEISLLQARMVESNLQLTQPDNFPWYHKEEMQAISSHIKAMEDNYMYHIRYRLTSKNVDTIVDISRVVASFLDSRGRFRSAEKWLCWALELIPFAARHKHPKSLQIMSSLGAILKRQGRCAEADSLYNQVEEICVRSGLHNSVERISNMHYKAGLFEYTNQYEKAKDLLRVAATKASTHLGPKNQLTIHLLDRVGNMMQASGEHQEAQEIYGDLLLRLRNWPWDHPTILLLRSSRARVLRNLGLYREAEREHKSVDSAWKQVHEHPCTAKNVCDLGYVMFELGSYREAEQHLRRALKAQERMYGDDSPACLLALDRLSLTLATSGQAEEALQVAERAVQILQRTDSGQYLVTVGAIKAHGFALRGCGKFEEAEHALRRCVLERQNGLGKGHYLVQGARHDLALVLKDLGRTEEAKATFYVTWKAREKVLVSDHPHTLLSSVEYALLLDRSSKASEAMSILQTAQKALEAVLDAQHPVHTRISETLTELSN